jgi:hypothetical protein
MWKWQNLPHQFAASTWQQSYYTWLKRAWRGGLRLIVTHAGSSVGFEALVKEVLQSRAQATEGHIHSVSGSWMATSPPGDIPVTPHSHTDWVPYVETTNDRTTIRRQTCAMERAALLPELSSWMEIAFTPAQATDIIKRGKLAVVLGVEVDRLGELGFPTPQDEINWYKRLGVRHVFPVHLADNAVGGAATYNDIFNTLNDFEQTGCPRHPETIAGTATSIPASAQNPCIGPWERFAGGIQVRLGNDNDGSWLRTYNISGGVLGPITAKDPNVDTFSGFFHVSALPGSSSNIGDGETVGFYFDRKPDRSYIDWNSIWGWYHATRDKFGSADHYFDQENAPAGTSGIANNVVGTGAYIRTLAQNGMMIDVDHMGQNTLNHTMGIRGASGWIPNYPLIAGHSDFRRLATHNLFASHVTSDNDKTKLWKHESSNEGQRSEFDINHMLATRGMQAVGAGVTLARRDFDNTYPSDCGGSTIDFARKFNYVNSKYNPIRGRLDRGIAIGTDFNGFLQHFAPRFGDDSNGACFFEFELSRADDQRKMADLHNGVRYSDGRGVTTDQSNSPTVQPEPLEGLDIPNPNDASHDGGFHFDFNRTGLTNHGLVPDALQDAVNAAWGGSDPNGQIKQRERFEALFVSADEYIATWQRAIDACVAMGSSTCMPPTDAGQNRPASADDEAHCPVWSPQPEDDQW